MPNQVLIVGKVVEVLKDEIVIQTNEIESETFPITVTENIMDKVKEYNLVGNIAGIRGKVKNSNGRVIIFADKISFLSSNPNNEGGE